MLYEPFLNVKSMVNRTEGYEQKMREIQTLAYKVGLALPCCAGRLDPSCHDKTVAGIVTDSQVEDKPNSYTCVVNCSSCRYPGIGR